MKAWQSRCTHPCHYRLSMICSAQKICPFPVASSRGFPRAPVLWAHVLFAATTVPLNVALSILIETVVFYKHGCSSARLEMCPFDSTLVPLSASVSIFAVLGDILMNLSYASDMDLALPTNRMNQECM